MTNVTKNLLPWALILAPSLVSQAQITIFSDSFATSTVSQTPGTPTSTSTSYEIASTANSPGATISPGHLSYGLPSTASDFVEAQALFSSTPVSLVSIGDYLNLTIVFTDTSGILSGNSSPTLNIGLYNSGGTAPLSGLDQSGLSSATTFNRGGARLWQGYGATFGLQAGSFTQNSVFSRPPQTAATGGTGNDNNGNQDLLFNGAGTGTFQNPTGSTISFPIGFGSGLIAGNQYTLNYRLSLSAAGTMNVQAQIFAGAGTGGTQIDSMGPGVFGGPEFTTSSFDALAFGWHYSGTSGDPASSIDVNSILITTSVPEPQPLAFTGILVACLAARGRIRRNATVPNGNLRP